MVPRMTAGKTLKDSREIPHGTTTKGIEETDLSHTVGLTTDCSLTYPRVRGKYWPHRRVDSRVPLVGFSGEHSWPLEEVPLEVTIGDSSLTRMEVLNFVIIRSNSPHNLLLERTAMHRMGIVVSTIYEAIKFHTPKGIGTVLSTYEPPKRDERKKKPKATCLEIAKNVRSCEDAEERIIVNTKYPEQMIAIGKQLPTNIKESL
ncbi:hypothetical protein Tco_0916135 [Tanacetum coccineum]